MHPRGMPASCHGKEDVSVLAGPHLHMITGFTILCKVCGGKMSRDEKLLGKRNRWSCTIISKMIDMCRRRKSWNWSNF